MTQQPEVLSFEIALLKKGDDGAWEKVFTDLNTQLYRFFRSRVPTHQVAEDLVATVFLEAFRCIHSYNAFEGIPFVGWLYGIARRTLASHYREAGRQSGPHTMCLPVYPPDHLVQVEIRDILDRINPAYREALILRYIIGLSGEEAAAATGRSHGAFRSLLLRAVRAYRAEDGRGDEPLESSMEVIPIDIFS